MCCGWPNLGKSKTTKVFRKVGICAVCNGLDGDKSLKDVEYCPTCDEWICVKCTSRWLGRGWLATKKMFSI